MISIYLFGIAILASLVHRFFNRAIRSNELFLSYILLLNMGIMGLLAAYGHIFLGAQVAREIGWQPGSPFQFEIGMANLSYGVLGVGAFWLRGKFWDAAIIGWSVFLFGCFVGHIIDYYQFNNTAPYNIGPYVWFNDLLLPFLSLTLLIAIRSKERQ